MYELPDLSTLDRAGLEAELATIIDLGRTELAKDEPSIEGLEVLAAGKSAVEAQLASLPADEPVVEEEPVVVEDVDAGDDADRLAAAAAAFAADETTSVGAGTDEDTGGGDVVETIEVNEVDIDALAAKLLGSPDLTDALAARIADSGDEGPVITSIRERMTAMQAGREADRKLKRFQRQGVTDLVVQRGGGGDQFQAGTSVGRDDLVEIIAQKHAAMASGNLNGNNGRVTLASGRVPFGADRKLGSDLRSNDEVLSRLIDDRKERAALVASGGEAIVATGGPCAPLQPTYEINSVAEVQGNLQAFLETTTAGRSRGGVRYTPPIDYSSLADGIGIGLCDNSTSKPVVAVTACPTDVEVCVRPISRRIKFDNLNYVVYPELVEYMLDHLAVMEDEAVEVEVLDRIDALTTSNVDLTGEYDGYGSSRGTVALILAIAHHFRKQLRMKTDAVVDIIAPDVLVEVVKADMVNDHDLGSGFLSRPTIDLQIEFLRRFNINLAFNYYDSTAVGYPSSEHRSSTFNKANIFLPGSGRIYVSVPGSLMIADGGSLDLGIVRDSTLNAANDLELFSERWFEVFKPGQNVRSYDLAFDTSGAGPSSVTPVGAVSA